MRKWFRIWNRTSRFTHLKGTAKRKGCGAFCLKAARVRHFPLPPLPLPAAFFVIHPRRLQVQWGGSRDYSSALYQGIVCTVFKAEYSTRFLPIYTLNTAVFRSHPHAVSPLNEVNIPTETQFIKTLLLWTCICSIWFSSLQLRLISMVIMFKVFMKCNDL